jgi:hypothetical protein
MFRIFNLVGAIHELPLHVNKIVAEGLIYGVHSRANL